MVFKLFLIVAYAIYFQNMKNPIKKTSTKIFVDEYDKYCQGYDLSKRPQKTEQKKTDYHRYIDQQLAEESAMGFPLKFSNRKREGQEESPERKVLNRLTKITNDNGYDMLSSDQEEDPLSMLLERRHNKDSKYKMKNIVFPEKKEEVHHRQKMYFKESEYFPEEIYQKSKIEQQIITKEKRPNSSMANKTLLNTNNSKNTKEKGEKLQKALSTSKFKEQNKRTNQSSHKEKQSGTNSRNPQTYKNNITLRKHPSNQQPDPLLSRLKKKPINMAPKILKIQRKNMEKQVEKNSERQAHQEQQYEEKHLKMKESRKREISERSESETKKEKINPFNRFEQINRQLLKEREKQQIRKRPIHQSISQRGNNRQQRREPPQRQQPIRNNRRQREREPRTRQQRPRQDQRQRQRRNNRNPRYQSSNNARRPPPPHDFLNFFSQTINEQLELMNNQFSMMSNIFQNFSNFVNINIDSHGNHFHFSTNIESSDEYTDSSDSNSSQYDDYYENDSDPGGLNESELEKIEKLTYRVSLHGINQCTICLIDLKNGDQAKKLFCEHVFHSDCIDEWLKRKSDCPVCRDKQ